LGTNTPSVAGHTEVHGCLDEPLCMKGEIGMSADAVSVVPVPLDQGSLRAHRHSSGASCGSCLNPAGLVGPDLHSI